MDLKCTQWVSALLVLYLWGCSQQQTSSNSASSTGEAVVRPTVEIGEKPAALTQGMAATTAPETAVSIEPAADPARIAFSKLTTRGISVEEWEAAHQALIELGVQASDVLRKGLSGNDPIAKEWAAAILALNPEAAVAARDELIACLEEESGYLRANAAAALSLVPGEESRVLPALLDLFQSSDVELRRMAAVNLGNLGDQAAAHIEQLQPLLADRDPEVVRPIVELLGRLGPAAMPALPQLQQIAFERTEGDLKAAAELAVEQVQSDTGPQLKAP